MAIEWGKQAWNEVAPDTIIKCFKKTKMYPQEEKEEDDPFEGKDELPALQELLDKIGYAGDASALISNEEEIAVCAGFVKGADS